jgi:MFS family permease
MIRAYSELFRTEPRVLLFGAACAFLSSPGQTYFISLFTGAIAAELGLGASELGALYLVATLGAAGLLPLAGQWIDRIDLRHYVVVVMAGLAAACAVMAGSTGAVGLVLALLLLRLTGQGLMSHIAATSIARYFATTRGRALSVVAMGFALAEGVLPVSMVALIAVAGWRGAYGAIGAAVLLVLAPALVTLIRGRPGFFRPPGFGTGGRPRAWDGLWIVVRTRFFWCALPLLLFMPFTSTALVFHIQLIGAVKGWSSTLVAGSFAAYAIGHASGLLISGGLVDRFGARVMLLAMNLPLFAGIALLGGFDAPPVLLAFLGGMGLSSGFAQTAGTAVWAEVYGVARLGTIRSFAVMLMVAGTALGPATIGLLLDLGLAVGTICAGLVAAGIAATLLAAGDLRRSAQSPFT